MAKIYNNNEKFSSAEEIYEDGKITTEDLDVADEANMYNLYVSNRLATSGYFEANGTAEFNDSVNFYDSVLFDSGLTAYSGYFYGDITADSATLDGLTANSGNFEEVRKANGGEWIAGFNDLSDALNYLNEGISSGGIENKGDPSSSRSFILLGDTDSSSGTDMITSGYQTGYDLRYEPGNRLYCNNKIYCNDDIQTNGDLQTGYITITSRDIQNNDTPWGQVPEMSSGYTMLSELLQNFEERISALESRS